MKSEAIASNIPAAIHQAASKADSGAVSEASVAQGGFAVYTIWIWLPENNIKIGDLVTDNFGVKSKIDSIEFTPVGYKLTAVSTKANS